MSGDAGVSSVVVSVSDSTNVSTSTSAPEQPPVKSVEDIKAEIATIIQQSALSNDFVGVVYDHIHNMVEKKKFDQVEFMQLVAALFVEYQKMSAMDDAGRKVAVKALVSRLLQLIPLSPQDKVYLELALSFVDPLLNNLLDMLYTEVQETVQAVKSSSCWAKCCGGSSATAHVDEGDLPRSRSGNSGNSSRATARRVRIIKRHA